MQRTCFVSSCLLLAVCLFGALAALAPSPALAYCGDTHLWAGRQATWLFTHGLDDPSCITDHGGWPIYPELVEWSVGWDPASSYDPGDPEDKIYYHENGAWVSECSKAADGACVATLNHFWKVTDGLYDETLDAHNSWEVSNVLWLHALSAWNEGDLGWAYENLGYCMHHIQDMLQPAHSNADIHPSTDAIEDWFLDIDTNPPSGTGAIAMYSWDGTGGPEPGPEVPYPNAAAKDNAQLLQDILNSGIPDVGDDIGGFPELADPNLQFNMQKYFYLLYWANQVGSWFASDDVDGQATDPIGWMAGFPGFPTTFPGGYAIYDYHGLDNNVSDCGGCTPRCRSGKCDADWDLTTIAQWCYAGVFKASPALIDLFRRTVDGAAPETTVTVSPPGGPNAAGWYNTPVTVALDATDRSNPAFRPSGVWKVWGLCDGNPPADPDVPSFLISEDGKHTVECKSTDKCGNVEDGNDIAVWVDTTPPEITFPDLRHNYLTSEDFAATWNATDATSGVASEIAYLDGQQVTNGQVFDLGLMAGLHTLRVIASDNADNWSDVTYSFEVFIDANAWAKPISLNDKTSGNGLSVVVEFPAPYDVGQIKTATCRLGVRATIDLAASGAIVGATALLPAERIGGVGDSDGDRVHDRMLGFNKQSFATALGGMQGTVPNVVRGGLLPSGTPRFLAVVSVPVFTAPKQ